MAQTEPIAEQLRQAIREAEKQGLSRYRLAKLSGVSEGQLSRIMYGSDPRAATLEAIAEALGYRVKLIRTK